jgi:cytochrome c biogenesis protein CcmG, thiol:disulfide interchange protein DsbE
VTRSLRAILIGVIVATPLVFLLALGFRGTHNSIASPLVGHPAPSFSLRALEGGRTISLAQLRGRPVVLNFWQSSCIPCRTEHPYLLQAYRTYGRQVAFVGVSYEDTVSGARSFLRNFGGGWPTALDPDDITAINYGVYGIPETFFIDRSGVIRYKSTGPVTPSVLQTQIRTIVRGHA